MKLNESGRLIGVEIFKISRLLKNLIKLIQRKLELS
jgi:uncharacterized protein YuzE